MREADGRWLDVFEMTRLRGILGLSRMDRVRNEDARRTVELERKLSEKVDQRLLRWYGHMIRMDEELRTV